MSSQVEIGRRIKLARKSVGMSQEELSHFVDRDHTSLSKLELGQVKPNIEVIEPIAAALRVSVEWLLFGKGDDGGIETRAMLKKPLVSPRTISLLKRSQKQVSGLVGIDVTEEQTLEWLVRKAGIEDGVL